MRDTLDTFNPNKPALIKKFFWATYIEFRNPNFKLHANRGHALNALKWDSTRGGILYRWNEATEEWIEVFRKKPNLKKSTTHCQACNLEFTKDIFWGRYEKWITIDPDNPWLAIVCRNCDLIKNLKLTPPS